VDQLKISPAKDNFLRGVENGGLYSGLFESKDGKKIRIKASLNLA
jgi:hypothetical protein